MSFNRQTCSDATMVSPPVTEAETLLEKGVEVLTQGNMPSALYYFEKAFNKENSPLISSYYAFCIAKERRHFSKAISLCQEAISKDPQNPFHYLNLGRIYLLANEKTAALKTFREGLQCKLDHRFITELTKIEPRKPSVIPFLQKNALCKKYLGIALKKMKLR
jgi:tetratricopeptide (TPR) repeat protein